VIRRYHEMTDQPRLVTARSFDGWAVSLHPAGPKLTITCGWCRHTFRQRVPRVSHPRMLCPACKSLNLVPVIYGV
jgi:hypothetical protein